MIKKTELDKPEQIITAIGFIRGQRVILDTDLAQIYGVPVKRLNEQIKRNLRRFPIDFAFRLTSKEAESLRSQFATLNKQGRGQHRKYIPRAFTEQGAIMAANVLNSVTAVRMSVFVVRAFVRMRAVLSRDRGLAEELKKLESKLTGRLDAHEIAIVDVLRRLIKLLEPRPAPPLPEVKPKGPIGFQP